MRHAETIAKALGGHPAGDGWVARCPGHDDRTPSLSIREAQNGIILIRCHAGCSQAHVIDRLRARRLWPDSKSRADHAAPRHNDRVPEGTAHERTEAALAIWEEAVAARGTLVDSYLQVRGIYRPAPKSLRFHAGLRHPSGGIWPAMVALVRRGFDGMPMAIHRTFLARNGARKASVKPSKMMLGPCRGGVVKLGKRNGVLMIGEGIETCLAAMEATPHPAWAALSTSGLRTLVLPADVQDVIVLEDGDDAGEAAAMHAALRWSREGRRVRVARPPRGTDFNDLLLGEMRKSKGNS